MNAVRLAARVLFLDRENWQTMGALVFAFGGGMSVVERTTGMYVCAAGAIVYAMGYWFPRVKG